MPIYEYECEQCDAITEVFKVKPDPDEEAPCAFCGEDAQLAISVPAMQPDDMWNGHFSISLGRHFNSRREYNDHCKRHGFEQSSAHDRGAYESAQRAKAAKEEKQRKRRHEFVAEQVRDRII